MFLKSRAVISKHWVIFLSIIVLSIILIPRISFPIIRKDDANTVRYALFARNLIRLPISLHKLANINSVSDFGVPEVSQDNISYYLDHPPLITWLTAISLKLFKIAPQSYRIIPIISTILSLIFLYKILYLQKSKPFFIFTFLFLYIFNPLIIEHGEILNFEPTTFALLTISLFYFIKYIKLHHQKSFFWSMFAWCLALLSDWPAFFAVIPYVCFLFKIKDRKKIYFVITIPLIIGILLFSWYGIISYQFVKSFILNQILFKQNANLNILDLFRHLLSFSIMNFTYLIAFSLIGFLIFIRKNKNIFSTKYFLLFYYGFIGGLNVLLFLSWADFHRFWTYYLIPAILYFMAYYIFTCFQIIKPKMLKIALIFTTFSLYIIFSQREVNNRRNSQLISLQESRNITKVDQLFTQDIKLSAESNIYQTHEGLLLRLLIDRQLTIQSNPLDKLPSLVNKSINCQNSLAVSKSYKICL